MFGLSLGNGKVYYWITKDHIDGVGETTYDFPLPAVVARIEAAAARARELRDRQHM